MIISHKYKFIFLKTEKTAGTSIEIALSKYCGTDDIITPISAGDEETRKELNYPGPQNYLSSIWCYGVRDIFRLLLWRKRKLRFYNHISAKKVRAYVGRQIWNNYYKFCFERNPWDRVISRYFWSCRSEPRPSISDFIKSQKPLLSLKFRGFNLYTINGEVAVDKVCRFENISEELEAIRRQLGIPGKFELPRAKSKFRKDKRSYRVILSEEDKVKISEVFRDELNLFGYEF